MENSAIDLFHAEKNILPTTNLSWYQQDCCIRFYCRCFCSRKSQAFRCVIFCFGKLTNENIWAVLKLYVLTLFYCHPWRYHPRILYLSCSCGKRIASSSLTFCRSERTWKQQTHIQNHCYWNQCPLQLAIRYQNLQLPWTTMWNMRLPK